MVALPAEPAVLQLGSRSNIEGICCTAVIGVLSDSCNYKGLKKFIRTSPSIPSLDKCDTGKQTNILEFDRSGSPFSDEFLSTPSESQDLK